jgi:signal transduction histidine kinase
VRVAADCQTVSSSGAYYIVSDALANVAKHTHVETVTVSVEAVGGC